MAPPSETEIRALLDSQSYNPAMVPDLEAYLSAQVAGDAPYMFDAVRTLVKLYHMFPECSNDEHMVLASALALFSNPNSTDFLALQYLIPQSLYQATSSTPSTSSTGTTTTTAATATPQSAATQILQCAQSLDACRYADFWKSFEVLSSSSSSGGSTTATARHCQALAKRSVGRLQTSIIQTLALTYQRAPTSVVLTACNCASVKELEALNTSTTKLFASITADTVVFAPSVHNTKRQHVYQEGVSYHAVSSMLGRFAQ